MRTFAIYNVYTRHRRPCAWLKYEARDDSYEIELAEGAGPGDLPFMLALFAEQGETTVPNHWARRWAETRVPPQDRCNIGAVLRAHKLDEYYLPALLAGTKGRSAYDDFLLEEVPARDYRSASLSEEPGSPKDFGTELSRARRALGMTQRDLAEACGIPQATISRIEHGQGNPTLETLETLARGCGRSVRIELE